MDLMTLAAKLTLDDSAFNAGIERAEGKGKKFASSMKASAVAVGNFMYDAVKAGVGKIEGVISGAIDSYADYQQLIGGVETLFKTSADKVAGYAKESFRTTGLSANDYMQTVTSFSASLIQGLGSDTEQAAEIANMAVTDMADNANKMGTDIASIQNAYQGFAKKNYTMLDNLKLGYGGTAAEMVRLINDSGILNEEISDLDNVTFDQMIKAIHQIQTNLDITGTTAKEAAETISGSKSSLGAAWKDLLSAVGGEGDEKRLQETVENFKESFKGYIGNFVPSLVTTIGNSDTLVEAIADSIASLPTDLLTKLGTTALDSGTGIVNSTGKIVNWLLDSLIDMFKNVSVDQKEIEDFGKALGTFLGDTISKIVTNIPELVGGVVALGVSLGGSLIEGLFKGLFEDKTTRDIENVTQEYADSITDIELSASKSEAILNYMQKLVDKEGAGATNTKEWAEQQALLEQYLGGSGEVFTQYGNNVQGAIEKLREMTEELRRQAIMQAMKTKLEELYRLLGEAGAKKATAQAQIKESSDYIETLNRKKEATMAAYSEELVNVMTEGQNTTGWTAEDYKDYLSGISDADLSKMIKEKGFVEGGVNGKAMRVGGMRNAYEAAVDALFGNANPDATNVVQSAMLKYYQNSGRPEDQFIYNRSSMDYIVDPNTLLGLNNEIQRQKNLIADWKKEIKEADSSMEKLSTQISVAERGIEIANEELESSSKNSSESMEEGAKNIEAGLSALGAKFAAYTLPAITIAGIGGIYGNSKGLSIAEAFAQNRNNLPKVNLPGFATGLDTVPYDNYKAILHKNEAVLTAREADQWRKGGMNAEQVAGMISDAIEESMSKIAVMMSGEKVGDLTTKRVRNNIKAYDYARTRAMGG